MNDIAAFVDRYVNIWNEPDPQRRRETVRELWQDFLRFDPEVPIWPNRDRFVLSSGHASTLLYSILHLTGVKSVNEKYERLGTPTVSLDDLKKYAVRLQ